MSPPHRLADPDLFARFLVDSYRDWINERISVLYETFDKQVNEENTIEAKITLDSISPLMAEIITLDSETRFEGDALQFVVLSAMGIDATHKDRVAKP